MTFGLGVEDFFIASYAAFLGGAQVKDPLKKMANVVGCEVYYKDGKFMQVVDMYDEELTRSDYYEYFENEHK